MILNRYVYAEFLKPFIYTLVIFSVMFQIGHLFDRLPVFLKNGVEIHIILLYLFGMLPLWAVQALPVCTLIAGVLVLGNMSSSGEIFCLRSSGVSNKQILKPLFILGLVLTVLTFILGDTLMPSATFYARSLYRTYVDKVGLFKPVWDDIIVLAQNKKRITAKRLDLTKNEMESVTVEEYGDHFNLRQALIAKKAEWNEQKGWTFYDGVIRLFSQEGDEIVEEESFASAELVLPEKPTDFIPEHVAPEELSVRQLQHYIRKINLLGLPALKETVQFHLKFAFPFTHILVLTIGIPIAFKTTPAGGGRGQKGFGRMRSLAVALVIGFCYLMLITLGQALGETRKLPPWLAVWSANFIFAMVGIYLMKKVE